jgi:nitrogen fixation protein FixH
MTGTPVKKSKIPYIFFAFFATFIIADLAFIYISSVTWRGTVTEDAYEKGRKYNQTLLNNKRQKDLGWEGELEYRANAIKKGVLTFGLKDKNGKVIKDAAIEVEFFRPTQTGFDFNGVLQFDKKSGNYKGVVKFPLSGLWRATVRASVGDEIFGYAERIGVD